MTPTAFLRCASFVASALLAVTSALAGQVQYSHGDPTPLEQQALELMNRARSNPTQEGVILDSVNTWYSIDARSRKPAFFTSLRAQLAAFPMVPPLAFHPKLIAAAQRHSQDMRARNYFSHVNPEGKDPTARGAAQGYDVGVGENIDGGGASVQADIFHSHFGFMVEYDNVDIAHLYGHRENILSSTYTEVGVGVAGARQGGRITHDFGGPARTYIVGVAYNDANSSASYDAGEGLAGITVTPDAGNWFATTSTSGGFAIPIDPAQTITDSITVPFNVQGNTWAAIQPYDAAYRQQQIAAAPNVTVNLTWSGGSLTSTRTTSVTMKRPALINYRIVGTDGWFYEMSMVTSQSVKADLTSASTGGGGGGGSVGGTPPPSSASPKDLNGDGKGDLVFQNRAGQIYAWFLDGTGSAINFATGSGLKPGSNFLYAGGLGNWRLVARADLNNDGIPDLIFQNNVGQIYVWCLDGTGSAVSGNGSGLKVGVSPRFLYGGGLGDWRVVACTDMNGDGNADLVLQNAAGQIYLWLLDGTANTINFATGAGLKPGSKFLYSSSFGGWRIAACTDVNGDGIPDLVFQNSVGQIYVWTLDGTATTINFATGAGLKPGSKMTFTAGLADWRLVTCTDMNGDDNPDFVFQNGAGQIYVWHLDGTVSTINFATGTGLKPGSKLLYGGGLGDWRAR